MQAQDATVEALGVASRSSDGSTPVIDPAVVVPRTGGAGRWTLRWNA